jgi:hypothetical protein
MFEKAKVFANPFKRDPPDVNRQFCRKSAVGRTSSPDPDTASGGSLGRTNYPK